MGFKIVIWIILEALVVFVFIDYLNGKNDEISKQSTNSGTTSELEESNETPVRSSSGSNDR